MTTRAVGVAAMAAAVAATIVGLFVANLEGGPVISDTPVYQKYGEWIAEGQVPYRDFSVEYPPGALPPFAIPALLSSNQTDFDSVFQTLMILVLAAISSLIVLSLQAVQGSTGRILLSLASFWAGLVFLGAFVMTRFDLFAAMLTLGAVCAILHRRSNAGPVLLGAAIATKIYPAVLLPLLVARTFRHDGRREAVRALLVTVTTAVLVYLPFAIAAPDGVARSIWQQLGRPLQVESLGAGVLLVVHNTFGMPLAWASGSGSQNLTGAVSTVASLLLTLAGISALLLVWVRFAHGDAASNARFAQHAAAATVAFVAFGKVLSPQFLVWLLAAVVLVPGLRGAVATAMLVAACLITRMWFPEHYWSLVKEFDPTSSWLVLLRDLVLVGVFSVLVARAPGARTATARAPESA